uniref:Uncharacterized protein n=1 Tax=Avena sativa TaxID=4498 RepID=A0ACD5V215_AVESA
MTRRRLRSRPASPPAALEVDDLLRKIFILLPPQPSTLPRISAVCKQWRGVVTDPRFLRGFRDHHRKPPVLGLVMGYTGHPFFRSNLSSPDLIPHGHFFPPDILNLYMELLGCRHGRVLFFDRSLLQSMVWDPATGDRRSVAVPPPFDGKEICVFNGAVLCAASDEGHVHGDCHSSPFQVILIGIHTDDNRALASIYSSVYSSETRTWGGLISTVGIQYTDMYDISAITSPATLVGDSLYWLFDWYKDGMLIFDLDSQSLVNIEMPDLRYYDSTSFHIIPTNDSTSSIRLAILEYQKFEMWERKVDFYGVTGWVLQETFQMDTILGVGHMGGRDNLILGYDEDDHVIYVRTFIGVCMIQLDTMQFKNLGKDNFTTTHYYPYRSFYTAGISLPLHYQKTRNLERTKLYFVLCCEYFLPMFTSFLTVNLSLFRSRYFLLTFTVSIGQCSLCPVNFRPFISYGTRKRLIYVSQLSLSKLDCFLSFPHLSYDVVFRCSVVDMLVCVREKGS